LRGFVGGGGRWGDHKFAGKTEWFSVDEFGSAGLNVGFEGAANSEEDDGEGVDPSRTGVTGESGFKLTV